MHARANTTLRRIGLVVTDDRSPSMTRLASEMPSIAVERQVRPGRADVVVEAADWLSGADLAVDRRVEDARAEQLTLRGEGATMERVAIEVLTRCQRFVDRRNEASASPAWDAARRAHEALHDRTKPLVVADLNHAVDTWQWMLRLSPSSSLAVQLAALFHDVERLESEADRRVEQHAPDYVAFKVRHARRGAERAYEVLRRAGVDARTAERARDLVASHERRGHDLDVDLLNDADGLSFFSLNSPGYADYFGPEQTRRKVAYTLARLGDDARRRLAWVRLRRDVRAHLEASAPEVYA